MKMGYIFTSYTLFEPLPTFANMFWGLEMAFVWGFGNSKIPIPNGM
jgi:hypothetical protein